MRHRIAKSWRFEASHQLGHLPQSHQCSRLHGHGYRVEVVLEWSGDISAREGGPGLRPLGEFAAWLEIRIEELGA